nr:MAG TPA: hypothetical protein [Caudoviricetes sp.]
MQLFGEGANDATTATTNENVAGTSQETTTAPEPATEPAQDTTARYLVTDPQTGRKRIVSEAPAEPQKPEAQAQQEPTPTEPAQEPTPAEPQEDKPETNPVEPTYPTTEEKPLIQTGPYTLDELNAAINSNTVDESRIPVQYQLQYQQFRQQQAQRAQQLQAQQAQLQQQAQQAQQEQLKKMFTDIETAAENQARQVTGVSQQDLETADYSDDAQLKQRVEMYNTAKQYYQQQLIGAIQSQQQQAQQAKSQQDAIYQSIAEFVADKSKTEKHFQEINQMMTTHYQNMPFKDAAAVSDAIQALNAGKINEQQCKALESYYNVTRAAYYAKANNLTKQPKKVPVPKVEGPGTGATEPPKPFDFSKLRDMTERERRAALSRYWHGR